MHLVGFIIRIYDDARSLERQNKMSKVFAPSIFDFSPFKDRVVHIFMLLLCCVCLQSIVFYAVRSPRLDEWLSSPTILEALQPTLDKNFIDLDPVFNMNIDEDYDFRASGITRNSFCNVYMDWIQFCATKRSKVGIHLL